jgi:hypothetical protein
MTSHALKACVLGLRVARAVLLCDDCDRGSADAQPHERGEWCFDAADVDFIHGCGERDVVFSSNSAGEDVTRVPIAAAPAVGLRKLILMLRRRRRSAC